MKKALLLTLALSSLSAMAAAEDLKATLQPIYTRLASATKAKDVATLEKLGGLYMTKDMTYVHKDGRLQTARRMLDEMKEMLPMIDRFKSSTMTIEKVRVKGSTAEVFVVSRVAMTMKGQDGKVHQFSDVERTQDSWVKQGGKWMLKRIKSLSETSIVDGKTLSGG